MKVFKVVLPANRDLDIVRAEGVIFSDESSFTKLYFCSGGVLAQNVFDEHELIKYIKDNDIGRFQSIKHQNLFKELTIKWLIS